MIRDTVCVCRLRGSGSGWRLPLHPEIFEITKGQTLRPIAAHRQSSAKGPGVVRGEKKDEAAQGGEELAS